MKNKFLSSIQIIVICIFCSCNTNEEINTILPDTTPKLSEANININNMNVVLNEKNNNDTIITFSWNASTEDKNLDIQYEFYMNVEGKDLFKGFVAKLGNKLSLSFTHKQLNDILLRDLLVNNGEKVTLDISVYSKTTDNNIESVLSKIKSFTATTQIPNSIYIIGAAYDPSWNILKAGELIQISKGIYEAKNIRLDFGLPNDGKGIKFLLSKMDWAPFIGQNRKSSSFGDIGLYYNGDSQIYPLQFGYKNGIYTISININTLKMTLTKM